MTLYPYQIPNKYFAPHKVVVPFTARVSYEVVNGKVNILEVGLSESACKYVRMGKPFMDEIRKEIESKVLDNQHVNQTIMAALAPHI
jgi:hypothetical protein